MGITYQSALAVSDNVVGWLTPKERDGLLRAAIHAYVPNARYIEVGSFQGKSSIVIASVLAVKGSGILFAIDPHEGVLSYPARRTENNLLDGTARKSQESTLHKMIDNLYLAEVRKYVYICTQKSTDVNLEGMGLFDFIFIDGLHDQPNVTADWNHFSNYMKDGSIIAWHDYHAWDGVTTVVNDLLDRGIITWLYEYDSLIVTRYTRK